MRHKGYYQAAFHSRLAQNLARLGYGIERDGNSFRLAGIDKATTEKFSRRSAVIEEAAERLGVVDPKAKGELGRRTREGKDAESLGLSELRKEWLKRLSDKERTGITEARGGQRCTSPDAAKAMDYALSHCFERASALPEKELLKVALIQSVGSAEVKDIHAQLSRDNVIRRDRNSIRYATTKEVLREELAMSAFVREGRGKYPMLGGIGSHALDAGLSREQHEAALTILSSRDRVTGLKGGAGTGKTRMIQATVQAIESGGKKVFTVAPSADASRGVLRSEGFTNAETVERLLIDAKLQGQLRGQVIWCDEAGLLSVKDMKRLFDVAKSQDARVVLSGDTNQHNAVSRGDGLRILERDAGIKTATLKEIRRQTHEDYRRAVKAISEGDAPGRDGRTRLEDGVRTLDGIGAIIETRGEGRFRQIASDYAAVTAERKAGGALKSALVVSPTHAEAEQVSDAIRSALKAAGRLGKDEREFAVLRPKGLTEAERGDARQFAPGMVVQFHQNAKGFKRGERVTVTAGDGEKVEVRRKDGSIAALRLGEVNKFQLYEEARLRLAAGDKLRITRPPRGSGKPVLGGTSPVPWRGASWIPILGS